MAASVPTVGQELVAAFKQLTLALARYEVEYAATQAKLAQQLEEIRALREQLAVPDCKPSYTKRKKT